MTSHLKTAALVLAITATGTTAALAGKTTTPNPTSPPTVVTTTVAAFSPNAPRPPVTTSLSGNGVSSAYLQQLLASFVGTATN